MNGILLGLGQLVNPMALAALLGGVVIGLIVGSLPGLNDSITMAVLIPITFGMEPQVAICLLIGIYCASACGGSIPSILLKIPGTASATVTAYDGYPMSQKGKSGEALGFAISSSTFGGISSAIVLLFLSPFLAKQAGFGRIGEKVVDHRARKYGSSKFGLERTVKGYLDLITVLFMTHFGRSPMYFFGSLGTLMFLMVGGTTVWIIAEKLWKQSHALPLRAVTDQPLFYLAILAVILGVQLFLAGFLGELINRGSSERNKYLIDKTL